MSIYKTIQGQGEDIVLIHGWGCDHRYMQPIADQLASTYRVSNIDLPGRGKSSWEPSINNIYDMVNTILPHLPERAIYIPWSFGGLITIALAAIFPRHVKQIIGIAISPKFVATENWPGIPKPGFIAAFDEIQKIGFNTFFKNFYDLEFANFGTKPKAYSQLLQLLNSASKENVDILLKGINICDTTDLRNELQMLCCPIDLIFGNNDGSIPKSSHTAMKLLNSKINIHEINGAQHMPFWTHPTEFQNILKSILDF